MGTVVRVSACFSPFFVRSKIEENRHDLIRSCGHRPETSRWAKDVVNK